MATPGHPIGAIDPRRAATYPAATSSRTRIPHDIWGHLRTEQGDSGEEGAKGCVGGSSCGCSRCGETTDADRPGGKTESESVAFLGAAAAAASSFYIREGSFDMEFDDDYSPPTSVMKRRQMLQWVLGPFYNSTGSVTVSEIDDMIVGWDLAGETATVTEPTGDFWTRPLRQTLIQAIRMIDVYRDYIRDDHENCCGTGTACGDRIDAGTFYVAMQVLDEGDDTDYSITLNESCSTCLGVPTEASYTGARGSCCTDCCDDIDDYVITVYYGHLAAQAMIADRFLYLANLAYWYSESAPERASYRVSYRRQARQLGRLALGAISTIARTLLHEQIHRHTRDEGWRALVDDGHCDFACCMQTIALEWQCALQADLGLYTADAEDDGGIDVDLAGTSVFYNSSCGSFIFEGTCSATTPGSTGDPTAYSTTWTIDSPCDTATGGCASAS